MKTFIFFFVLLIGLKQNYGTHLRKRSLISRFTTNPFFLSHFQNHHTFGPTKFQIFEKPTNNFEEDGEEITYVIKPNLVKSGFVSDPTTDKPKPTQIVETQFNQLPLFEKTTIFENKKEVEAGPVLYIFKSVPHFDRKIHFREKIEVQQPNKRPEDVEKKFGVTYYFSSLPHFERKVNFQKPELLVSQVGSHFVSQGASHLDQQIENGGNLLGFKSLPHFERIDFNGEESPKKKLIKVIRRKKVLSTPENVDRFSKIEFGKRLKPKISVADLPLENVRTETVFNSYGDLV